MVILFYHLPPYLLTMTARNTVLLILKQNPGIDYNSLLSKVSPDYSNINSARAALSRTLKDLGVFGFIRRENNTFFVTDKADAALAAEMKNKLVLKLNREIKPNRQTSVESVVQALSTLIERSKHDENLIKAAKTSSDFFISDLVELAEKTSKKVSQLQYLEKVLRSQIDFLKELNFNDVKKTSFSEAVEKSLRLARENGFEEVIAEVYDENLKSLVCEKLQLKPKEHSVSIKKDQFSDFFSVLSKQAFSSQDITVFLPPLRLSLGSIDCYFVGPFNSLGIL